MWNTGAGGTSEIEGGKTIDFFLQAFSSLLTFSYFRRDVALVVRETAAGQPATQLCHKTARQTGEARRTPSLSGAFKLLDMTRFRVFRQNFATLSRLIIKWFFRKMVPIRTEMGCLNYLN